MSSTVRITRGWDVTNGATAGESRAAVARAALMWAVHGPAHDGEREGEQAQSSRAATRAVVDIAWSASSGSRPSPSTYCTQRHVAAALATQAGRGGGAGSELPCSLPVPIVESMLTMLRAAEKETDALATQPPQASACVHARLLLIHSPFVGYCADTVGQYSRHSHL